MMLLPQNPAGRQVGILPDLCYNAIESGMAAGKPPPRGRRRSLSFGRSVQGGGPMAYLVRRFFMSLFTLFLIVTITFFLMHLIPGGPFSGSKSLPPAILHNLEVKFGLNKPLYVQYVSYLGNALHGDLGVSIQQRGTGISGLILAKFPVSAGLGLVAVAFATVAGTLLGIAAALKNGKAADRAVSVVTALGTSVPSFVVATISMVLFCVVFRLLPSYGLSSWQSYLLPAFALSLFPLCFIARLMRSSMIETLSREYIKAARAKGLTEGGVIFGHALKNAILPAVTYLGPLLAGILTGSFVIEQIFSIPGLGALYIASIGSRDYALIMGTTIFYGAFLIGMNFLVDILYTLLDPRIRFKN